MYSRLASLLLLLLSTLVVSPVYASLDLKSLCGWHPNKGGGEIHRYALIVGVSLYISERATTLPSAANDAARVHSLLTEPGGFGFPKEHVCLLQDEQATLANFTKAFKSGLLEDVPADSTVVIYFSGHGTQVEDDDGDELDKKDEALVLHDSLANGIPALVDDQLHALLEQLHVRTQDVTLIFDSCNSGSSARGIASGLQRSIPTLERASAGPQAPNMRSRNLGADGEGFASPLPGMVVVTAAMDGTFAFEDGGSGGYFTTALIETLRQPEPLTWRQAASRVQTWIQQRKPVQVPQVYGATDRLVFGQASRARPLSWTVQSTDAVIRLGGPPMPNTGRGAEFRIYDGASISTDYDSPWLSKTRVRLETSDGLSGTAKIVGAVKEKLAIGDVAILIRPAHNSLALSIGFDPSAAFIRNKVEQHLAYGSELHKLVRVSDSDSDLVLIAAPENRLLLRDANGIFLNEFRIDSPSLHEDVLSSLRNHAHQKSLLNLRGEGGSRFVDGNSLGLSLVVAGSRPDAECTQPKQYTEAASGLLHVNLGSCWLIQVESRAKVALSLGIVVLSSDGVTTALPPVGTPVIIEPQSKLTLPIPLTASLPLRAVDTVLVFGTQPDNPVQWHMLDSSYEDPVATLTENSTQGRGRANQNDWTVSALSWTVIQR